MRKIFSILFLTIIIIGCRCENTETIYTLTDQEKSIIPYLLQDTVRWNDNNNNTYNGIVTNSKEDYFFDSGIGEECISLKFNYLLKDILINNIKYSVVLNKRDEYTLHLSIQEYDNDKIIKSFITSITLDSFTIIEFNGETYENAVLLKESVLDGMPFGHLIYSKTHGIEFILFEDGTWYKRVE